MKPLLPFAILALAGLTGCAMTDPYQRQGIWRPQGSNEMNFELQVARAADLVQGRGSDETDADLVALAIDRLKRDKVKALPSASISTVGGSGASGGASGGGS